MNYRYDPPVAELLTGQIDAAIRLLKGRYVAWTKDWEGPARPDLLAAQADLRDRLAEETTELFAMIDEARQ